MPMYKARVACYFDIVIEDADIEAARENIELSNVGELLDNETEESLECIGISEIAEIKEV